MVLRPEALTFANSAHWLPKQNKKHAGECEQTELHHTRLRVVQFGYMPCAMGPIASCTHHARRTMVTRMRLLTSEGLTSGTVEITLPGRNRPPNYQHRSPRSAVFCGLHVAARRFLDTDLVTTAYPTRGHEAPLDAKHKKGLCLPRV